MTTELQLPGANGEVAHRQRSVMAEASSSREAAEVQAAMFVAKQFPRDVIDAQNRITVACRRPSLAKRSMYAYPRGGQTVTGPSIRLAEMIAQNWGNIDFGVKELEKRNGESTIMAYAIDLETNTRVVKVFSVKHWRDTKAGGYALTDERDIYELVANQGARRLRACILGIIPGDVTEAAVDECKKTLAGDTKEPLIDRARKMVAAFAEHGVTKEMIERRLAHKLDAIIEAELVDLRAVYQSIKDGFAPREQYFELEPAKAEESLKPGRSKIKKDKPAEGAPATPATSLAEGEIPNEPEPAKTPVEAPSLTNAQEAMAADFSQELLDYEGDKNKLLGLSDRLFKAKEKLGPLYEPTKAALVKAIQAAK